MAQLIKQGNIFGRIGSGIGQGLAEQVPKEIERNRLASGLENLENQNLSPTQQYASLVRSGANSEQINQVFPFLRNAALARGSQENSGDKNSQPNNYGGNQGSQGQSRQGQPQTNIIQNIEDERPNIQKRSGEEAARAIIQEPRPQEIDSLARKLMVQDPNLHHGENAYASAYQRASDMLQYPVKQQQQEIAASERQTTQRNQLQQDFEQTVSRKVPGNIPSDVQERFMKKAEFDLANGKSKADSIKDNTDTLQKMGKNLVTMQNNIGGRPFFGKAPDQLNKDVQKLRPVFAENDELELFKDNQKLALDIGDHLASTNTWLPKQNQVDIIKSLPKDATPEVISAKLGPTIDKNTSLFTLGYMLNKAGYDDESVINSINDLNENKIISLDDRQQREAAEYYSLGQDLSLGDILWNAMAGPVNYPLRSLYNYVTGTKEKLGPVERLKRSLGKE